MKKFLLISAAAATALLSGCAMQPYQPGLLFTNMSRPAAITNNTVSCEKHGTSSATNVLGLFSTGDASVAAAKANGNISTIGNVDVQFNSILGIISHTTTEVCGK